MRYQAIFLDLDNTLYAYEPAHIAAMEGVLEAFAERTGRTRAHIEAQFEQAKAETHARLALTASSHSRVLYFQRMAELLRREGAEPLALSDVLDIHALYWARFYAVIKPFAGAIGFLEALKEMAIPVCIVTDFTAEAQLEKLSRLGMAHLIDTVVTSEEAGIEKPHPQIFLHAAHKLGVDVRRCVMIGDSHGKDCVGAERVGMRGVLIDPSAEDIFGPVLEALALETPPEAFFKLCTLPGGDWDRIQAGGGNASLKQGKTLWIKASGALMSEVGASGGYAQVDLQGVRRIIEDVEKGMVDIDDDVALRGRMSAVTLTEARPSIETFLHAVIPEAAVVHTHSSVALTYAASRAFEADLKCQADFFQQRGPAPWFIEAGILLVPYCKPGIELAVEMKRCMDNWNDLSTWDVAARRPLRALCLQSHGLIVFGDFDGSTVASEPFALTGAYAPADRAMALMAAVEDCIRKRIRLPHALDAPYVLQRLMRRLCIQLGFEDVLLCYLSDGEIQGWMAEHSGTWPEALFPDAAVFGGVVPLILKPAAHALSEGAAIASQALHAHLLVQLKAFLEQYGHLPKVIIYDEWAYAVDTRLSKCLAIQDVLKLNVRLHSVLGASAMPLGDAQCAELVGWEAERYRTERI